MKHIYIPILLSAALLASCSKEVTKLSISSSRDFDTYCEIASINISSLNMKKVPEFRIVDSQDREIPYQITYDGKLIFPVSLKAGAETVYSIVKGSPAKVDTLVYGAIYPDRRDDMAWESDKVGFRAYGPGTKRAGDRLYGYDIFLKRDASEPLIPGFMALNNSKEIQARIDSLKKAGLKEEARALDDSKSYHIDHGHGMDCYAVGPTLGAGTTALVHGGSIVYPWVFEDYKILDNGPLRFTVALTYPPAALGADTVIEHRIISIDAGSHLNRTLVKYEGLNSSTPIVTGIVLHDSTGNVSACAADRYIAYTDPTQGTDNGELYIGAVFTAVPDSVETACDKNFRQILAHNCIDPQDTFTYYWGAGWNHSDIPSWDAWLNYLSSQVKRMDSPIVVEKK